MSNISTDQRSPGSRRVQRYSVAKGYSSNNSDASNAAEERGVGFVLLKNCLVDKRLDVLLKRPGSLTETITNGLGLPLGMTEYVTSSNGQTIPINRTMVVNFAGSKFYQNQAGTWSEISKTSYVNFATSRQCTFAKIGTNMFIAAGLPAKWGGPGRSIDRVGIVPPASRPTITSYNTGSGITLTEGTRYVTTYYASSTGLESDWSDPSDAVPAFSNKSIVIGIPAETQKNWDKIRIYRYLDGGAFPYLVDTVNAGTTSYTDSKPDAQLTAKAAKRYDRLVPPTQAYLTVKFAQCIWYVDGSNPYKLVFSKPYTGSDNDLEYFPIDNYVISNEPITALLVVPGKLLVFHPRGISYISGFSVDDFVFQPWINGTGTVFSHSVSTNGTDVVFLAEQGFVTIPAPGGEPRHISREIDLDLQPLLAASYNASLYVSSAWNPSTRQFVFSVAAQSTAGAPWEEVGTGSTATAVAGWQTTPGLVDDIWEDVNNPNTSNALKIRIWGWSRELSSQDFNQWMEYTFPSILTDNVAGAYPLLVFHPSPSADTGDPQQDKTYIGIWDGTQGKIIAAFRKDRNTDDGATITAEWITTRLVPGQDNGGFKLFQAIGFDTTYSDPTSDSLCTLKYLLGLEDPHLRSYTGSLITISDSTEVKKLPTMQGKFMHLYGTDTSQSQSKVLLSKFHIHYRERFRRETT